MEDKRSARDYAASWRAIMHLVRSGSSWSGRERNCVFINCGLRPSDSPTPCYANASAVSGLDFPDDGRALAFVDWDQDGDLDVWLRNRTAPRLRLMRNRLIERNTGTSYLALRLRGTTSNRDAIGARVEVLAGNEAEPIRLVQTVRAGDAFLSQSSKWLHFGLGHPSGAARKLSDAASQSGKNAPRLIASPPRIRDVFVDWPGGERERFAGLRANGRYELRQGTGQAVRQPVRSVPRLAPKAGTAESLPVTAAARVVLPGRIALPRLQLRPLSDQVRRHAEWDTTDAGLPEQDTQGTAQTAPARTADRQETLQPNNMPTLITFWTSACPNCRRELASFVEHQERFRQARLDLLAVCLDGLGAAPSASDSASGDASSFLRQIRFPFRSRTTDLASLERIRLFQQVLFDKYPPFVVPLSFLVDAEGQVVSIYRGAFSQEVLLRDIQLTRLGEAELRDVATPLAGSWFTKPATRAQFAEYLGERMYAHDAEEALRYYRLATELAPESAAVHFAYAVRAADHGDLQTAEDRLRDVLRLEPDFPQATQVLQRVLAHQPIKP